MSHATSGASQTGDRVLGPGWELTLQHVSWGMRGAPTGSHPDPASVRAPWRHKAATVTPSCPPVPTVPRGWSQSSTLPALPEEGARGRRAPPHSSPQRHGPPEGSGQAADTARSPWSLLTLSTRHQRPYWRPGWEPCTWGLLLTLLPGPRGPSPRMQVAPPGQCPSSSEQTPVPERARLPGQPCTHCPTAQKLPTASP